MARATAPGMGAVGVVRMSGVRSLEIAQGLVPKGLGASHQLVLRDISDSHGQTIDQGLVVFMAGPRSYTGEDTVEFQVHGSPVVVQAVVEACVEHGARCAQPGEFTERAFLHGRLDLTQAEGVADLIAAESQAELRVAQRQVAGTLSRSILGCLEPLEKIVSDWRAALDFPEYPTESGADRARGKVLDEVGSQVDLLVERARVHTQGHRSVVVCGPPNAGKSTLVNLWAGEKRVLVHDAPGTTRDPVEVRFANARWSVWDTAGLRDGADSIEAEGIEMARERIGDADLTVWLVPADRPVWPEGTRAWVVLSRCDLVDEAQLHALEREAKRRGLEVRARIDRTDPVSAQSLFQAVSAAIVDPLDDSVQVTRARQVVALKAARDSIRETKRGLDSGRTLDVLTGELERAVHALGRVLGRDVESVILERIFRDFCIGK